MDPQHHFMAVVSLCFFNILLCLIKAPTIFCVDDPQYFKCTSTVQCGDLQGIGYPFWGLDRTCYCGLAPELEITCVKATPVISIMNQKFRVLCVDGLTRILTVARTSYSDNLCPKELHNISQVAPFTYSQDTVTNNLTLYYGCPSTQIPASITPSSEFTCPTGRSGIVYVLRRKVSDINSINLTSIVDYFGACNASVIIPVNQSAIQTIETNTTIDDIKAAINQGFGLQWADAGSCGNSVEPCRQCGQDENSGKFACHRPERTYSATCPGPKPKRNPKVLTAIPVALGALLAIIIITTSIFCMRIKFSLRKKKLFKKEGKQNDYDVDEFMRNDGSPVPRRYKYADVKEMTDSFSEKLRRGGYGEVYKGKLKEGPLVAVKILKESKANDKEFINEVVSITRTADGNIVALLGLCYRVNKRAWVYEYMPNGSLDRFLPSQGGSSTICPLEWKISYQIATGIAQELEYLHRGCSTRILHLDIKPQIILLDQDFAPKISDFGLAKLCKGKESIVSMLGARRTCAYIALEVMSRNFGGVSHKSNVYSYGMLILGMIGARNNSNDQAADTSEMCFEDMVYRHLDLDKGLQLDGITTKEEEEIARKMIIASIWCIQVSPSDRPSVSKAIEMLEASLELLPIPPKPSLSSPSVSPRNFEITSLSSTFTNSMSHQRARATGRRKLCISMKPVPTCITSYREYDRQLSFTPGRFETPFASDGQSSGAT